MGCPWAATWPKNEDIHLPENFLVIQEWLGKSAGKWEPSYPVRLSSPFCKPDVSGGMFFSPHSDWIAEEWQQNTEAGWSWLQEVMSCKPSLLQKVSWGGFTGFWWSYLSVSHFFCLFVWLFCSLNDLHTSQLWLWKELHEVFEKLKK